VDNLLLFIPHPACRVGITVKTLLSEKEDVVEQVYGATGTDSLTMF
jgi:hypothetical protein